MKLAQPSGQRNPNQNQRMVASGAVQAGGLHCGRPEFGVRLDRWNQTMGKQFQVAEAEPGLVYFTTQ